MTDTSRTYKGWTILPCESAYAPAEHRGRWIVRDYSAERQYWDSECKHFWNLADAKSAIRDRIAEAEYYAAIPNLGDIIIEEV